jgi:cysteine desulfurase/selenocysteine lyase
MDSAAAAFARFRAGFPALRDLTYLSICDKVILHDAVRASVDLFLDRLATATASRGDHEVLVQNAKGKFARLINAPSETIAAIRNVSDGMNIFAGAMTWREGDNVVITAAVEIRIVDAKVGGEIDAGAMIAAIDARTKLMSCASVTFAPGHRTDISRLGEACRRRDILFLVDGVQSAGILQHDVSAEPVDGFVTSTSKGLLGLYGFGFLYAAPDWLNRLEPAYLSRPAVVDTTEDHSAMGAFDYELRPDGGRFEVGSFNFAGTYAADAALDLLLGLGQARIEARVLNLAAMLHGALSAAGFPPAVPASGPSQSHIVTVGALDAGGHGYSTDPQIAQLSTHLAEHKIIHTIRRGQLRFALHAYNDESDIERTVALVGRAIR